MARELHGLGVSAGIAAGPVAWLAPPPALPATEPAVADAAAEEAQVLEALGAVAADLRGRASDVGGSAGDVLEAQALMAADPMLADAVVAAVRGGRSAPFAVDAAFAEHRALLAGMGGYMAERVTDLDDVRTRVVARLLGLPMPGVPSPGFPFVLVAEDLAPADTAGLDRDQVLAIVTRLGGPTSHTAILAKQLGIPAVSAVQGAGTLVEGERVLVDGATGEVIAEPDDGMLSAAEARAQVLAARRAAGHGPGRTADGHAVALLVNLGGPGDLQSAAAPGVQGVGLLRTEFLFLDRAVAPTFEEQQASYAEVFAAFTGRRVVVRTLDVGADKPLPYIDQGDEPNPALGVRGLRLARRDPALLDEQLRAIAAAAEGSGADVWVMAPMISTAFDAEWFAGAARGHGLPKVGAMIEVPSAALCADEILRHVDFASIGTNDLAQYTMASDRMAGELAALLDPWQPAVLKLVGMTAVAGVAAGKSVGVCGEAASDPLLACVLVGLGVTSLSMAESSLPDVRATLAAHTLADCRALAALAVGAASAADGRAAAAQAAPALA